MVFDDKKANLKINEFPNGMERHVYLKRELSEAVATIKAVYENEVRTISYNVICKIAINLMINQLDGLTDEEAIELLKTQHKEVILL